MTDHEGVNAQIEGQLQTTPGGVGSAPRPSRLAAASRSGLSFVRPTELRAHLLVVPLVLSLSLLAWSGVHERGAQPLATSLVLAAAGLALAWTGVSRRETLTVDPERLELTTGGRTLSLPASSRWTLDYYPRPLRASGGLYVARLGDDGEPGHALLVDDDPARLLDALRRTLDVLDCPVECRWGLPANVEPWRFDGRARESTRRTRPTEIRVPIADPRQSTLLFALFGLLLLDLYWLMSGEAATLDRVHPVSLVLPALLVLCLGAVALRVGLGRRALIVDEQLTLRPHVSDGSGAPARADAAAVRGVHLIGFDEVGANHVLLDTHQGPLSLRVPARCAQAVQRRVIEAIELARPRRRADEQSASLPASARARVAGQL